MENKKNSKKTVKLLVVLIALLLIACSILGITLARYVTQGDPGTAGVGIANWDVKDTSASTGQFTFEKLSPYQGKTGMDETTPRSHSITTEAPILSITNSSDVDALVTLVIDPEAFAYDEGGNVIDFTTLENRGNGEENCYAPWQDTFNEIFKITFTVKLGDKTLDAWTTQGSDLMTYSVNIPAPADGNDPEAVEVTATVTWTTDTADAGGAAADLRDTWIGEHVASVRWGYSWTAEQNSQIPTP